MFTSSKNIIALSLAVFVLVAYNFSGASWTKAPAKAPGGNAMAPIHVGIGSGPDRTSQQIRGGLAVDNLVVGNIIRAGTEMRAPRYCDKDGKNCNDAVSGGGGGGDVKSFSSYHTTQDHSNVRGKLGTGRRHCSCKPGDILTGCSGFQASDRTVRAVQSSSVGNYCEPENYHQEPTCSCLTD